MNCKCICRSMKEQTFAHVLLSVFQANKLGTMRILGNLNCLMFAYPTNNINNKDWVKQSKYSSSIFWPLLGMSNVILLNLSFLAAQSTQSTILFFFFRLLIARILSRITFLHSLFHSRNQSKKHLNKSNFWSKQLKHSQNISKIWISTLIKILKNTQNHLFLL